MERRKKSRKEREMGHLGLILVALAVILIANLWSTLKGMLWRPQAITKKFREQGVMGPEYKFRTGCLDEISSLQFAAMGTEMDVNSHDIVPRVLPHYHKWMQQYGKQRFPQF